MPRKTKMNSITSPELLAQVNPDNKQLKEDFLDYLKSTQKSSGTIAGYSNDLDIFFVWVLQKARNKSFVNISKRDIVAFQNWLINENENSSARVRRIKAAISSLSNFIENILDDDPEFESFRSIVRKIENPKLQPVREKTVFDNSELEELLNILVEEKKYDKACCLALAMYSGRRKSELVRFKVSDFDDDKLVCDNALYKSAPIKTKGRGNGKYINCYTLAKKFKPYLDLWLKERESNGISSEWLFYDYDDKSRSMPISTLNSWAISFSKITGKDFYWHSLRHYFTTALSRAGIPDGVIQTIVAWDSSDMVRIYKDIDAEEEIAMFFKDGDIAAPATGSLNNV